MKPWLFVTITAISILLGGCASPAIRSDVTVFQELPADLRGQTFVFERSKEQDNNLEYRTYENLVRNELQRLGFAEATATQTPTLKVTVSYSIRGRDVHMVEPVVVDDPFWPGPYPYYGRRWRGYYGPFYDPFWYGSTVGYRESNFELFKRQLHIVMLRAADAKKVYDVTVDSEGRNGSLAVVMPYLVRSAFAGFPGKNGETRRIELKMKDDAGPKTG